MSSRAWSNVPISIAAVAGLLMTAGPAAAQVQTPKLQVRATVGQVCTVSAASLDFGTYASAQLNKSGSIAIQCLTPMAVNVALDGGQAGNGNGIRTMKNGSSSLVYQLFKDPGFSQSWQTGNTVASPSNANHTVSVYGQISPSLNSGTLANGVYTDEVTITLSF
jgi:spore coat protein U domain-containing protein, fimbrial subunit CupE1/2/3/6